MYMQLSLHFTKSSLQQNGLKSWKHIKDIKVVESVLSSFIGISFGQCFNAMIDENVVYGWHLGLLMDVESNFFGIRGKGWSVSH